MLKPSISKKAFWDISFDELDFEKSSLYVMEKVFNYGSWNDLVAIMKYYSLPRIRQEIIQAKTRFFYSQSFPMFKMIMKKMRLL